MIEGLTFVGIRTGEINEMVRFFETVFDLKKASTSTESFVEFKAADGARVELYDLESGPNAHLGVAPVVGFEVRDFDAAAKRLRAANCEILGEAGHDASSGNRWLHFRTPDGTVFEIVHHPERYSE